MCEERPSLTLVNTVPSISIRCGAFFHPVHPSRDSKIAAAVAAASDEISTRARAHVCAYPRYTHSPLMMILLKRTHVHALTIHTTPVFLKRVLHAAPHILSKYTMTEASGDLFGFFFILILLHNCIFLTCNSIMYLHQF